jgi:hypothetical protein
MLQRQRRGPSAYGTGKGPEPCREKSHQEAYDEWLLSFQISKIKSAIAAKSKAMMIPGSAIWKHPLEPPDVI